MEKEKNGKIIFEGEYINGKRNGLKVNILMVKEMEKEKNILKMVN